MPAQPLPPALRPFIESLDFEALARILQKRPWLYCHPVVVVVLQHLQRLVWDESQWRRLRWRWREQEGTLIPPAEVDVAYDSFRRLVEAHFRGLFPGLRRVWKPVPRRPGPKPWVKNPHPSGRPENDRVYMTTLDHEEKQLRQAFKARRTELRQLAGESRESFRLRIESLVREVLGSSGVGQWSGLGEYVVREHTHSAVPRRGAARGRGSRVSVCWLCVPEHRWTKPLPVDDAVIALLTNDVGKEGRPRYMALVLLAKLLDMRPENLRDRLDRFRRRGARHPAPPGPPG